MNAKPDHLYRSGVGIMILNKEKKIFVGKRIDNNSDAWQMPQGGTDVGEDEDKAMRRELEEETGIKDIEVIGKSRKHLYYNLPYKLQKRFWSGQFLGQKQRWYLVEFLGNDSQINIATEDQEFSHWRWATQEELLRLYEEVIAEFKEFLR